MSAKKDKFFFKEEVKYCIHDEKILHFGSNVRPGQAWGRGLKTLEYMFAKNVFYVSPYKCKFHNMSLTCLLAVKSSMLELLLLLRVRPLYPKLKVILRSFTNPRQSFSPRYPLYTHRRFHKKNYAIVALKIDQHIFSFIRHSIIF